MSEIAGGMGGGLGGGGWGKGRWKFCAAVFGDVGEGGEKEYTSGPVNGFAYLDQHFLHGRSGSASLYPIL